MSARTVKQDEFANVTINDLKIIKTVGTGSYGEVDLVVHKKSGKQLAVKKIDK